MRAIGSAHRKIAANLRRSKDLLPTAIDPLPSACLKCAEPTALQNLCTFSYPGLKSGATILVDATHLHGLSSLQILLWSMKDHIFKKVQSRLIYKFIGFNFSVKHFHAIEAVVFWKAIGSINLVSPDFNPWKTKSQ